VSLSEGIEQIEPDYLAHRQNEALDALQKGEVEQICVSAPRPVDQIVSFGLKSGFLKPALLSFPDPRKKWEVPIDILLLAQILQRLNDEHSLLLAPYMLNSADLITELGYNASVLTDGFNDKAIHPRQTAFHGETLKHLLLSCRSEQMIEWFNKDWLTHWRANSPGRSRQYVLDGMKIPVPLHLQKKYQGSGIVKDQDDNLTAGYKAVWIYEIIDRKGVIVGLKIGPIQTHDLELGKALVRDFPFEEGSSLIMDRGFIDSEWIKELKEQRKIDVFLPLRHNMDITQAAIAKADNRRLWKPHPTRKDQQVAFFTDASDLAWPNGAELKSAVLARWKKRDGTEDEVLFVTTREKQTDKMILATYDQRSEIEEAHRQLKLFQGIETLPSKKLIQVVFRILMGVIGYNLLNLFLNSEQCSSLEDFTLKTLRQKRVQEKNVKVIVYTKTCFAVITQYDFFGRLLDLEDAPRKKLKSLFKNLDLSPAPL
jgi:hypothetical protein